jgi:hypothetical protein
VLLELNIAHLAHVTGGETKRGGERESVREEQLPFFFL